MKNILLVHSSPRGSESYSQRVADSIVKEIKNRHLERVLPLLEVRRAHELSQGGHTRGKIVLRVKE
jgi:FMN-dependent NADH-azoreductase